MDLFLRELEPYADFILAEDAFERASAYIKSASWLFGDYYYHQMGIDWKETRLKMLRWIENPLPDNLRIKHLFGHDWIIALYEKARSEKFDLEVYMKRNIEDLYLYDFVTNDGKKYRWVNIQFTHFCLLFLYRHCSTVLSTYVRHV